MVPAPSNPTYKWNPNGKVTKTEDKKVEEKGTGFVNYCKKGGMISECGVVAGKKWKDHRACKFSVKSDFSNRCMFYVMDGVCDCMEAQKN